MTTASPTATGILATLKADIAAAVAKAEAVLESLEEAVIPVAEATAEKVIVDESTALVEGDTKDTGKILATDTKAGETAAEGAAIETVEQAVE